MIVCSLQDIAQTRSISMKCIDSKPGFIESKPHCIPMMPAPPGSEERPAAVPARAEFA
jgi:hypothetical protein